MTNFTNSHPNVLVAGWWPAARPWHVCAWSHLELLSRLVADMGSGSVALAWPGACPQRDLGVDIVAAPGGDTAWGRLVFEQVGLPQAARRAGGDVIFIPYAAGPLSSPAPVVAVADEPADQRRGFDRITAAAAAAGLAGAWRRIGWDDEHHPDDVRQPRMDRPAAVSPAFGPAAEPDDDRLRAGCGMPEAYALALGASLADVPLLLAAWSWMTTSLGDSVKLVIGPLGPAAGAADELIDEQGMSAVARTMESLDWGALPAILRGASCLMAGPMLATPQVLRWSQACGLPVAGASTPTASAILGEAGFLVAPDDARTLGAAGLSLVVDSNNLARRLTEDGLTRAVRYHHAWGNGSLAAALDNRT